MPREKTKIFWILPNSYLNFMIEECKRKDRTQENLTKVRKFLFIIFIYFNEFYLKRSKVTCLELKQNWNGNLLFSIKLIRVS